MSRRGGLADLDKLFAIQKESAVAGYANVFSPELYPYPGAEVRESLRRQLEEQGTVVLLDEQGLGFALVGVGWLHRLYVRPSAWGEGVGAALHDDALAVLREAADSASSGCSPATPRARGLYERRGWRPSGAERTVSSPPNPLEVGYSIDLSGTTRL